MTTYIEETFEGRFEIDGHRFERCVFSNAILVYSGGEKPVFKTCHLNESIFLLQGAAGNTLATLQSFAQPESGFQGIVRSWFPALFAARRRTAPARRRPAERAGAGALAQVADRSW